MIKITDHNMSFKYIKRAHKRMGPKDTSLGFVTELSMEHTKGLWAGYFLSAYLTSQDWCEDLSCLKEEWNKIKQIHRKIMFSYHLLSTTSISSGPDFST